jgi:hypothetical protein
MLRYLVDLTVKNEKNETGASGPRGGCARDIANIPKYTFSRVGYRGARCSNKNPVMD